MCSSNEIPDREFRDDDSFINVCESLLLATSQRHEDGK